MVVLNSLKVHVTRDRERCWRLARQALRAKLHFAHGTNYGFTNPGEIACFPQLANALEDFDPQWNAEMQGAVAIAIVGFKPVGVVIAQRYAGERQVVVQAFVKPEFRCQGIASKLLDAVKGEIAQFSKHRLEIVAGIGCQIASPDFWKKHKITIK